MDKATANESRGFAMIKHIAAVAGGVLILSTYAARAAEAPDAMGKAAAKVAVELCSACHGPGGNSTSPTFPKLDGQQKMYLMGQIRAFKAKSRSDPEAHDYMWGMAATVDDSIVEGLADYFSSQPPPAGRPGDPKLIAQGEKLFHNGDPTRKIAACAGCHGKQAEGQTIFPRLAGQHAAYLVRQLQVIQKNLRNSPIMHGIIPDLTPADMQSVAQYLQSL
jgi:cytochrome c553